MCLNLKVIKIAFSGNYMLANPAPIGRLRQIGGSCGDSPIFSSFYLPFCFLTKIFSGINCVCLFSFLYRQNLDLFGYQRWESAPE
jgi:hypothetical protein